MDNGSIEIIDDYFLLCKAQRILNDDFFEIKSWVKIFSICFAFILNYILLSSINYFNELFEAVVFLSEILCFISVFFLTFIFMRNSIGGKIIVKEFKPYFINKLNGSEKYERFLYLIEKENLDFNKNRSDIRNLVDKKIIKIEDNFTKKEYFSNLKKELDNYKGDKKRYMEFLKDMLKNYNNMINREKNKIDSINKELEIAGISKFDNEFNELKIQEEEENGTRFGS